MRKLLLQAGKKVAKVFDFFYPPFSRYMSLKFYHYGVSGSVNVVFDWLLYAGLYNFVFKHRLMDLGFIVVSSHIAPKIISVPITFFSGFFLQKYVTFTGSNLGGKTQLFRYLIVVLANVLITYIGLKIMVEYFNVDPNPSNMIVTIVCVIFSYVSQHSFTFKTTKQHPRFHELEESDEV
jgi:GtrA-like protein